MREMILCKLGEVVLKGLNRRSFEDKLIGNPPPHGEVRQFPYLFQAKHHLR